MVSKLVAAALGALVLTGSAAAAAGGCHDVEGTFTASIVPCPAILCTEGLLAGDLTGTYAFVADDVSPEGALLASSTITLDNGAVIHGSDTSVLNPDGTFTTTLVVVGGTRQYAKAKGGLVAAGAFTPDGGTAGTYAGTICLGVAEGRQ